MPHPALRQKTSTSHSYPLHIVPLKSYNYSPQVCPCGNYNHPEKKCVCAPGVVQKYLNKISGPLLDRIDIHLEVTPVPFSELTSSRTTEKSENVRGRVVKAREIQAERFKDAEGVYSNA